MMHKVSLALGLVVGLLMSPLMEADSFAATCLPADCNASKGCGCSSCDGSTAAAQNLCASWTAGCLRSGGSPTNCALNANDGDCTCK